MKKQFLLCAAGVAAAFTPGVAMAQTGNDAATGAFVGVSAGYHDLGVTDDDVDGVEFDDASPILGVVAGYDVAVGDNLFAGVEGNFHIGTDVIDNEFGGSVRFGFATANGSKYYLRGGYQEVDIDPGEVVDVDFGDAFDGIDTSEGDYLVGAGVELPVGPGSFRLNLDTIAFDSVRASAGFLINF
ncbi:MAG: hypothetical protein WBA51_04655 [Erythrobacter sp.]